MDSKLTTSQTIGPFPHEGWQWGVEATANAPGATLTLTGVVRDGAGNPVDDAMLEAWVPAAAEAEAQQAVPGFRRVPSDAQGAFSFALPPPAPGEPVCFVTLFARGLLEHQFCAVFLEDDEAVGRSPLLQQVPEARRATLLARRTGPGAYRWDINLQGEQETVFFDFC
jgi:protocatechuate 3,4-dioxygenase alpha subunit